MINPIQNSNIYSEYQEDYKPQDGDFDPMSLAKYSIHELQALRNRIDKKLADLNIQKNNVSIHNYGSVSFSPDDSAYLI